ncbi:MAG TPA: hypothetical protein VGU02_15580 [Gaiellaceae bacterium]|nr:hypothetical protein [Gaiellaceae bacterium]
MNRSRTQTCVAIVIGGAALLGLSGGIGRGANAAKARPKSQTAPWITGSAVPGAVLSGHLGSWSGHPTDFNTWWRRCDTDGGRCSNIGGSGGHSNYRVSSADIGHRLRFSVGAANLAGRIWKASAPSAVVQASQQPASCPPTSSPDDVAAIGPPQRLILDGIQAPSIVVKETKTLVLRFHVSSTCGGSVRGALVQVAVVPYFQFSAAPEQLTDSDGWVEVRMQRLAGFPASPRQHLLVVFVRARKAGEDPLLGISTRRLYSVGVDLRA